MAIALAAVEAHHHDDWRTRFADALAAFRFLPSGCILAGAGAGAGARRRVTLFNYFVTVNLHDSLHGIFSCLTEAMITIQAGGGVDCDCSPLWPACFVAPGSGGTASGPVSCMQVWNEACTVLTSASPRRGAMMAPLRCDPPDIEAFIDAKKDGGALRDFNLAALVSDDFMTAVEADALSRLVFPVAGEPLPADAMVCDRKWSGATGA